MGKDKQRGSGQDNPYVSRTRKDKIARGGMPDRDSEEQAIFIGKLIGGIVVRQRIHVHSRSPTACIHVRTLLERVALRSRPSSLAS
jgi:hypothetical protein